MTDKHDNEECWLFNFAIESADGTKLARKNADILMDEIILWAEANNCQIGGGYRAPEKGEFDNKNLYDLK
ncbi:MAG: hypothetical protein JKY02_00330 [Flavobacteriaceae bacterium]|nr:hypothetical protein [Flavobacteriaceae bacterium]